MHQLNLIDVFIPTKQKNDELTVQKLEKVEQMVNQGSASYNWVFPN
jgi:hypothetical protein